MLPYWFSALTMKSVGDAAAEMVVEVQRQFAANPELLNPDTLMRPDYEACIKISTEVRALSLLCVYIPCIYGSLHCPSTHT